MILSLILTRISSLLSPSILAAAAATFLGSSTVRTGVSEGICMVEWMLIRRSSRSLNGGQEPDNIDKEFLRLWFKEHSDPYHDEKLPEAPRELVVELSSRYIRLFEMITGTKFKAGEEDLAGRIEANLKKGGYLV